MSDTKPRGNGALAEVANDPASRKKFLKMMGGAGAAGSLAMVIAACGSDDEDTSSQPSGGGGGMKEAGGSAKGDLAIVNYALTLEYLEAEFYKQAAFTGFFKGAELELVKTFGEHEAAHVVALEKVAKSLGKPAAKPKTKFPLENKMSVLKLAADVENLGAAAYLGQAARIQNKEILAAALSIHAVEARHAAALNTLLGRSPTPDGAFAKPASMDEVLPVAKKFIVS